MTKEVYMRRALALAKQGEGYVSPNPMVGAVIVKNGKIIGEGWHKRYGGLHAEREALASCTESPEGAEIYVTLEPCCHYGKQPPCALALIESGIKKVYVGSADPNPLVSGKGNQMLREHGIEVEENVLREECDAINEIFFYYITRKRPFVAMKYAMTADGKIAAFTGASQWITGEAARRHVHELRGKYRAIMVGVGTVLADNPMLNCRLAGKNNPVRIVCDTHLRTPLDSHLVETAEEFPLILATCCKDKTVHQPYLDRACTILTVSEKDGHPDLRELMQQLSEMSIDSVLLEGGGSLNWSALREGIVNKVYTYLAPKLLGGAAAKSPVEGQGFPSPDAAVQMKVESLRQLGDDLLIESRVVNCSPES